MSSLDVMKMNDYKGFTIEPIDYGYIIVVYGKKHTLYFSGPKGFNLSQKRGDAKVFRTKWYCCNLLDEMIRDHAEWVETMKKKIVKNERV